MSGYFGGRSTNSLVFWHNPLIGRGAGRQILEIPFDDSIDGTHALECFFQMPSQVHGVRSAYVWVQSKPFRQYVSASSSSGVSALGTHSHTYMSLASDTATVTATNNANSTSSSDVHSHVDHSHTGNFTGSTTGANPLLNAQGAHGHSVAAQTQNFHFHGTNAPGAPWFVVSDAAGSTLGSTDLSHNHSITTTLTPGIFETAATGTLSLAVADDGVNYGASIVSGIAVATGITKQTLTGLTKASGDKRIKVTGTGRCRLQVLIVLDLSVAVLS